MSKKWKEEEIQFIKENYTKLSDKEIAIELDRTESSVATKRKHLGFKRTNRKYEWDDVLNAFKNTDLILISVEEDYVDSATNSLKYICPIHKDKGVRTISLGHLLNGEGCYFCGRETTAKKKTLEFDEEYYKKLCNERDYTYLGAERINGFISIKFICNKHKELGEQYQSVYNMERRNSCQYCIGRNLPRWYIDNQIKINNPNIEILSDYKKLTDRVTCRCKKHNIISEKSVQDVLRGYCCYRCGLENRHSSYAEDLISNILDNWGYKYNREYTFDGCKDKHVLPFDFYLEDFNTCIEYDGKHHYEPVFGVDNLEVMKRHDAIKSKFCEDNNIHLIRIPYWEYDDIENFLFNEFLNIKIVELIS